MDIDTSTEHLIRHVTLRQFQIFKAVADANSFSKAAEQLFLTQPTVSMQVKKLAETVGSPLFEQVGKRLYLTAAGERVLACGEAMFDALEGMRMSLADMVGLKRGRLRLSVVTTAEYFAPRVLGAFCEKYPHIEIELRVVNRRQLLSRIAANADDMYILGQPPEKLHLVNTPFMQNPQVALASYSHPLVGSKSVSLERFAQEPMIMREAGSGTRKAVEKLFRDNGLQLRIRMELGSNEAIKQAVAGGLGVSILSSNTLVGLGRTQRLAILDVQGFPLSRQWRLVYPQGKELTPVAQAFYDFVLQESEHIMDSV